jgi:hypothetical protein
MILRSVLVLIALGFGGWGVISLPFADADGMSKAIGAIGIGAVALIIALLLPKNDKYP